MLITHRSSLMKSECQAFVDHISSIYIEDGTKINVRLDECYCFGRHFTRTFSDLAIPE